MRIQKESSLSLVKSVEFHFYVRKIEKLLPASLPATASSKIYKLEKKHINPVLKPVSPFIYLQGSSEPTHFTVFKT